jgi:phospholipase/carboxylesterase
MPSPHAAAGRRPRAAAVALLPCLALLLLLPRPATSILLPTVLRAGLLSLDQASIDAIAANATAVISAALSGAETGSSGGGATKTSTAVDGDGYGGQGLTYPPAAGGNPAATVVVLHGLSATVEQMAPLVPIAQSAGLQGVRFILPQAPDAYVNYRQRVEPSWFNVDGTDAGAKEFKDEILAAASRIDTILAGEVKKGVGKVAVVGLSQGGAVASTIYMRSKVKLAGVVLLSTWLPLAKEYPGAAENANKALPAKMIHGGADTVVDLKWAQDSAATMRAAGRTVDFEVVKDAPHTFELKFPTAANLAISYLKERGIA